MEEAGNVPLEGGRIVKAHGRGNVYMNMKFGKTSPRKGVLYNLLYVHVPLLTCKLFSARAAVAKGSTVKFGHSECWDKGCEWDTPCSGVTCE